MWPIAKVMNHEITQRDDGGLDVTIPETGRIETLDPITASVYLLADGETPNSEIHKNLKETFGENIDEEALWAAFDRLRDADLLTGWTAPPAGFGTVSRRRIVAQLGAAAATVAVLMTPRHADAQSPQAQERNAKIRMRDKRRQEQLAKRRKKPGSGNTGTTNSTGHQESLKKTPAQEKQHKSFHKKQDQQHKRFHQRLEKQAKRNQERDAKKNKKAQELKAKKSKKQQEQNAKRAREAKAKRAQEAKAKRAQEQKIKAKK